MYIYKNLNIYIKIQKKEVGPAKIKIIFLFK